MSRLVPGQRLWPRDYNSGVFGQPVTVASVGRTRAKVAGRHGCVDDIPADDDLAHPGMHRPRRDFAPTYFTDAGRADHEARLAIHYSRRDINAALDKSADLATINQIRAALGLPEVAVWTPPETT